MRKIVVAAIAAAQGIGAAIVVVGVAEIYAPAGKVLLGGIIVGTAYLAERKL